MTRTRRPSTQTVAVVQALAKVPGVLVPLGVLGSALAAAVAKACRRGYVPELSSISF